MMRRILQPGEYDHLRVNWGRLALLMVLMVLVGWLLVVAHGIEWFQGAPRPQTVALQSRIDSLQHQIQAIQTPPAMRVRVTCYMSETRQTDSTPWTTAINTKCRPGIVAVSRDLLEAGWSFGRQVWIEGYGVYTIEDVMNARLSRSIDIWVPIDARPFAQDNVLAVLVER